MSIRVYRLLRNNREEGPFTAEELIQKNLRPYDLIWIDGRSAAWSYPGELTQFKKYVPLPGEESTTAQPVKPVVSASVQAAMAVNNNIPKADVKEKPRYKVSAAWSRIQTITKPVADTAAVAAGEKKSFKKNLVNHEPGETTAKSLSWEEAWLDWKEEKKPGKQEGPADDKPTTKQAASKKTPEPVLETKYEEPLDSLKDKYIENLLIQKQRSKKNISFGKASEFVLPAIALIVIFSVAYWFLNNKKTGAPALTTDSLKQEQVQPVPPTGSVPSPENVSTDSAIAQNNSVEAVKNIHEPQPSSINKAEERKSSNTHNNNTSLVKTREAAPSPVATVIQHKDVAVKPANTSLPVNTNAGKASNDQLKTTGNVNTENNAPARNGVNSTTAASTASAADAIPEKKSNEKTTSSYVNAPEYIQMNNGTAAIKIKNVSDIDLDLVVVDVQYYDASSRFRKGETLYLHHLKAGRDVVIKTPKDTNSLYATSKISLISSDAQQVYVIGDN